MGSRASRISSRLLQLGTLCFFVGMLAVFLPGSADAARVGMAYYDENGNLVVIKDTNADPDGGHLVTGRFLPRKPAELDKSLKPVRPVPEFRPDKPSKTRVSRFWSLLRGWARMRAR